LRVFVDKPGGVGIEDCRRASREMGDVLDAAGLIEEAYDLEVSSPGLDRQLRKDRELRWALGKRVRCWLAGGEEHQGRLVDVDEAQLVLDDAGRRVELPRARVTKARLDAEVPWPRRAGL
jgi:ribosome maturation factor RimP